MVAGGRAERVLRLPRDATPRRGEPRLQAATAASVLDAPFGPRIQMPANICVSFYTLGTHAFY